MMYKCDMCGGTFEENWSEEEALAEMERDFGSETKKEDCAVVCDECYQKLSPSNNSEIYEAWKKKGDHNEQH